MIVGMLGRQTIDRDADSLHFSGTDDASIEDAENTGLRRFELIHDALGVTQGDVP